MSTYLRNMAGYKHTQLKNKSFEEIQMLFDKEMKKVNSFVPMDSKVVEGSGKKTESIRKEIVSKKRTGEELDEESVKRQKLEDDWNGYLRKWRKTKPKRQNRTRNGKVGKDKVKVQAQA
ncbi:hypothetical protein Tco_0069610 [Tanacetum coccineum]